MNKQIDRRLASESKGSECLLLFAYASVLAFICADAGFVQGFGSVSATTGCEFTGTVSSPSLEFQLPPVPIDSPLMFAYERQEKCVSEDFQVVSRRDWPFVPRLPDFLEHDGIGVVAR